LGPPAHPSQGDPVIGTGAAAALPPGPARPASSGLASPPSGPPVSGGEAGLPVLGLPGSSDLRPAGAAARRGDRAALNDLVRVTYSGTYTLAYRLTGNEDDARDVVQDAYLRAYRGLRRFRGDPQFTTWLYRITANCSANLLAKRARYRTELLSDDEPLIDLR